MKLPAALLAVYLGGALTAPAGDGTNVLSSRRANGDAEPAANADSDFWKDIHGVFIESSIMGPPATNLHAEVRSRWTPDHLYLLFIGHFETLNLKPNPDTTAETDRLWLHDCFEVYLGAESGPTNRYREFQMSPQGEFLDLDIDSSRPRPGYGDERRWNSGFKVAAHIDETKKIWYGEMRIPFAAIEPGLPNVGHELRANFCRQDGTGRNRSFLAWQPTGVWSPHRPDKFGRLRLVDTP